MTTTSTSSTSWAAASDLTPSSSSEGPTPTHSYGSLSDDVGAALIERAPGATFACWTDPAYLYLGSVVLYAPDLGKFTADCDAHGTPLLGQTELCRAKP